MLQLNDGHVFSRLDTSTHDMFFPRSCDCGVVTRCDNLKQAVFTCVSVVSSHVSLCFHPGATFGERSLMRAKTTGQCISEVPLERSRFEI